jgi:hypothetical protein
MTILVAKCVICVTPPMTPHPRLGHLNGKIASPHTNCLCVLAGPTKVCWRPPIVSMPILDLHRDDVLLGRGALTVNNEGNKRFRSIVDPWKAEYQAANRKRKNEIAVTVVNEVFQRGGRFLERINESEMQALGLPEHGRAWKVAEMHVALEKV